MRRWTSQEAAPTVPLDPPTAYGLAALLVVFGRRLVEAGQGRRAFRAALAFTIFFAASVQVFLFRWPDWMYAYLVSAREVPPAWVAPFFFAAVVAAGAAGAAVSLQLLRAGRAGWALANAGAGIALWLAIQALTWEAYFHVGTWAQWQAGMAPHVSEVPAFGRAMTVAGLAQAAVGIGLVIHVVLAGRRALRLASVQPDSAPPWRPLLESQLRAPSLRAPGEKIEARRPRDLSALQPVEATRLETIPRVVEGARRAQAAWASLPLRDRLRTLRRLRRRFLEEADSLVQVLEEEIGRPRAESWITEIVPNADLFDHWIHRGPAALQARQVPIDPLMHPRKRGTIEILPRGVVALITPWNFPVALPLRTLVPALLAGNAVVWKPSEVAARTSARLLAILQAELPAGLVQLIQGGAEAGEALLEAGVDHLVFVGSPATGRLVAARAGRTLTSVTVELGGKDAALVLHDADLDRTARGIAWAAFANAGQNCAAIERCYVDGRIAGPFVARLQEEIDALRPGEDVGPLATAAQFERVRQQLEEVGVRPPAAGQWLRPTLVVDPPGDAALVQRESFGPVLPVIVVADEEEMVRRANESAYGLTASVWSRDRTRAEAIGRRLQAGVITIDNHGFTPSLPQAPFGGVRGSGFGATNGPRALQALTRERFVLVDRSRTARELWWYPYDVSIERLGAALARLRAGAFRAVPDVLRHLAAARRRRAPTGPARWPADTVRPALRPIDGGKAHLPPPIRTEEPEAGVASESRER